LGVKNFSCFNQDLLCKWKWRGSCEEKIWHDENWHWHIPWAVVLTFRIYTAAAPSCFHGYQRQCGGCAAFLGGVVVIISETSDSDGLGEEGQTANLARFDLPAV
jgi:hypothetical protein